MDNEFEKDTEEMTNDIPQFEGPNTDEAAKEAENAETPEENAAEAAPENPGEDVQEDQHTEGEIKEELSGPDDAGEQITEDAPSQKASAEDSVDSDGAENAGNTEDMTETADMTDTSETNDTNETNDTESEEKENSENGGAVENKEAAEGQETEEAPKEGTSEVSEENAEDSGAALAEVSEKKKNFFVRWKEKAREKERQKLERYELSEQNMKRIREERKAEMYADGKDPNFMQKFLMSEGKYINYENKQIIVLAAAAIIGIIIVVLGCMSGIITKEKFGLGGLESRAIVYSKDNSVYCYDLKHEPVMISDNLSSGGSATYSYVGSGTTVAEDGKSVYFIDNVAADGTFSLNFYMAGKSADPLLISDNVIDYEISYKGDGAVYVVEDPDTAATALYSYSRKSGESTKIVDGINSGKSNYGISSDGKKIIYAADQDGTVNFNICNLDGSGLETIDTDVAQYIITEKSNFIYYIKSVKGDDGTNSYSVYGYDIKKGTASLIDENVITVALSSGENALIYYKYNGNMIKASDIVNDDGDDSEEMKALRAEVAEYEFKDITCSVYRYENGKTSLVNDKVFTAIPMDSEGKYIAYTVPQKLDEIKVNLSEISSVNEISALYYMEAMQADCDTYIYELDGFNDYIVFENPYIYSFTSSGNNAQFACFTNYDQNTSKGTLMLATLSEYGVNSYSELEDDVTSFQFLGDGSRIVYLRGVQDDGAGTLMYIESNVADEISDSAYYYEAAGDYYRRVFYLDNYDSSTYGGTFHYYQQADDTVVDDNVYMFAYRNNNNALYMKDYNILTGTGDLYYLDGSKSVLVDEDVSSIFDFYSVA